MKFICDVMLGRLARRLRLLGCDVYYDRSLDDNEIIRISLEQQRTILTRDTGLVKRPIAAAHIFIKNDEVCMQLEELLSALPGTCEGPLSRCSQCNTELTGIQKEKTIDLVPRHVFETNDLFRQCETCGRIYWTGSHVKRMKLQNKKPGS